MKLHIHTIARACPLIFCLALLGYQTNWDYLFFDKDERLIPVHRRFID